MKFERVIVLKSGDRTGRSGCRKIGKDAIEFSREKNFRLAEIRDKMFPHLENLISIFFSFTI